MIDGSPRSAGVIERMIASTWADLAVVDLAGCLAHLLGHAGQQRQDPAERPQLLHLLELGEEVLEREPALEQPGRRLRSATSWSNSRSACSISVRTSPMPRMRSAIRSGWNRSKSARRSPVEAKAIGRPTTSLTLSAAPPRASPSSLVRMTPSSSRVSWKALRRGHGVLAGHGVDDEERVVGLDDGRRRAAPRPSAPRRWPGARRCRRCRRRARGAGPPRGRPAATATGSVGSLKTGTPACSAEDPELLDGGRALEVGADQQRVAALLPEPAGQLGRGGGLARALQAGEQDDRRRATRRR